jgi:translocator protein
VLSELGMHLGTRSKRRPEVAFALLAVLVVAGASILGQTATYPNLAPWYSALNKPSFTPPNWLFAPVWTTLYVLMAFGVWRVLRAADPRARRLPALILFSVQLVLNAAWSWMFFGARSPLLGLINILPQLIAVCATIYFFYWIDRVAAWCLVPLAVWVAFASILNLSIWWLNRANDDTALLRLWLYC